MDTTKIVHPPCGRVMMVRPGDTFEILLPDGSLLNVEQTQDDFSIVRANGIVAYQKATSPTAKRSDGNETEQTTGRN